jgi:hypothetical protein
MCFRKRKGEKISSLAIWPEGLLSFPLSARGRIDHVGPAQFGVKAMQAGVSLRPVSLTRGSRASSPPPSQTRARIRDRSEQGTDPDRSRAAPSLLLKSH